MCVHVVNKGCTLRRYEPSYKKPYYQAQLPKDCVDDQGRQSRHTRSLAFRMLTRSAEMAEMARAEGEAWLLCFCHADAAQGQALNEDSNV